MVPSLSDVPGTRQGLPVLDVRVRVLVAVDPSVLDGDRDDDGSEEEDGDRKEWHHFPPTWKAADRGEAGDEIAQKRAVVDLDDVPADDDRQVVASADHDGHQVVASALLVPRLEDGFDVQDKKT